MTPITAAKELGKMLDLIPADEIKINLRRRAEAEALKAGIEALREKAGFPPGLPGYITLAKTKKPTGKKLAKAAKYSKEFSQDYYFRPTFYLAEETYEILKAVKYNKKPVCSTTEKTIYADAEPLLCGLPVLFGTREKLDGSVYLVVRQN